jgi:hypothetical protein
MWSYQLEIPWILEEISLGMRRHGWYFDLEMSTADNQNGTWGRPVVAEPGDGFEGAFEEWDEVEQEALGRGARSGVVRPIPSERVQARGTQPLRAQAPGLAAPIEVRRRTRASASTLEEALRAITEGDAALDPE